MGAELPHVDARRDMKKLIVASRNFAKAPTKYSSFNFISFSGCHDRVGLSEVTCSRCLRDGTCLVGNLTQKHNFGNLGPNVGIKLN